MKTTGIRIAFFLAPVAATLLLGCKSRPVEAQAAKAAPAPVSRNFAGLWEGRDKKGAIYTFRLTNSEWESHIEKDGAGIPYCRGSYTFTGSKATLRVLEEADPVTLAWVPERGNFPPNISGRLEGGRLKIPILTDAELVKKH